MILHLPPPPPPPPPPAAPLPPTPADEPPPPLWTGAIIWVRWRERYRAIPKQRSEDVGSTVGAPPIRVRALVKSWEGAPPHAWVKFILGNKQEGEAFPDDWFPLDDAVDMLAHADGACVFCLDTGQLVGRPLRIDPSEMCLACRPELRIDGNDPIWKVATHNIAVNGETYAVKMTWSAEAPAQDSGFGPSPDYRTRSRLHLPGRFRPQLDRCELAERRSRQRAHSRRP